MNKIKHRNSVTTIVLLAVVIIFGLLRLNGHSFHSQPANRNKINTNRTVDFSKIQKSQEGVWPAKHLGVLVINKNKKLEDATKMASRNWQPAFTFQYNKKEKHNLLVKVALVTVKESSPAFLTTVMTHELGHALGLPHSVNKDDLMYRTLRRPKRLSPHENKPWKNYTARKFISSKLILAIKISRIVRKGIKNEQENDNRRRHGHRFTSSHAFSRNQHCARSQRGADQRQQPAARHYGRF